MRRIYDSLVAWGPLGIFLLTILDSAGIPNPGGADVALLLLCIARPRSAMLCAGVAVVGSLIGTMILFYLAHKGGEKFLTRYTSTGRGARFRTWFRRYGLVTVFIPALLPIPLPLKVFVVCAGALEVSRLAFFLVILAARLPRYFGLAWLGATLGNNSLGWIRSHTWQMVGFAAVLFMLLYGLVRWSDRERIIVDEVKEIIDNDT